MSLVSNEKLPKKNANTTWGKISHVQQYNIPVVKNHSPLGGSASIGFIRSFSAPWRYIMERAMNSVDLIQINGELIVTLCHTQN